MDGRDNEEFTALLRGAIGEAEKLKYRPHQFKKMLEAHGGFDTVNRILASGKPSDGFTRLWELGRLDLSCEAIIVETKWRRHFDESLIAKAEKLLGEMGYPFKRFEDAGGKALPGGAAAGTQHRDSRGEESEPAVGSTIRINAFFKDILHAPVANARWSWGAVDERKRRVFLRLWRMDIADVDGERAIRALGRLSSNRPGATERARHLELIKGGYAAYAVVCDKDSPESGVIRDFDRDMLLRLGRVIERDGMIYLSISASVPASSIATPGGAQEAIGTDLLEIQSADINVTTRAALVDARLGQGRFRRELLRRWDGACSVTGCRVGAVLRASHCKPWRHAEHHERLDSNNGLVLSANLDALFDAGLISFADNGEMLVSSRLSAAEKQQLGLPAKLLRSPGAKLQGYLAYHRDHVYLT